LKCAFCNNEIPNERAQIHLRDSCESARVVLKQSTNTVLDFMNVNQLDELRRLID